MKPPRVLVDPDAWTMEPKLDGVRMLWERTPSGVYVYSGRNGRAATGKKAIKELLMFLPVGTVLDSELITHGYAPSRTFETFVFDVLRLGEKNVMPLPWHKRRALLEAIGEEFDGELVHLVPSVRPDQELYERWVDDGLEGVVLKRKGSRYKEGSRSQDWTKLKPQEDGAEAIVIGYEMGKGKSNQHKVGALKVRLLKTGKETSCGAPSECRTSEQAEAKIGCMLELRHHGWTRHGRLRHPIPLRWRPDRD